MSLRSLQAHEAIKEIRDRRMHTQLEKARKEQEFAKPAPWEKKRDLSDEAVQARVAKMSIRMGV